MSRFLLILLILAPLAHAECPGGYTLMIETVYDGHPTIEFVPNFRNKSLCIAAGKQNMKDLVGAIRFSCVEQ